VKRRQNVDVNMDKLQVPAKMGMLQSTSARVLLPLLVIIILWYSLQATSREFRRRRLARQSGCEPLPSVEQKNYLFGLDQGLGYLTSVAAGKRNLPLTELLERLGSTYSRQVFGTREIVTVDTDNIKTVLSTNFTDYGVEDVRMFSVKPVLGAGVMSMDGPVWKHSRAVVQKLMARSQTADLSWLAKHVDNLIAALPKDGRTVDLQYWFARLELDFSTEFMFGRSFRSLTGAMSSEADAFVKAWQLAQQGMGQRRHLPRSSLFHWNRDFWSSCRILHKFVDKAIEAAVEVQNKDPESAARNVMAFELTSQLDDRTAMREQLLNVFLAAHNTTAIFVSNIYFCLARYPAAFSTLRKEVESFDGNDIDAEGLRKLPYLQNVLKETLRMHPPLSTTTRAAVRDTVLPRGGGVSGTAPVLVRKGDFIVISFYALHRDKGVYGDDSNTFRPERWDTIRPRTWEYMPFGGGPRVCPGQQLAMVEAGFILFKVMKAFGGIENRDPHWEFVDRFKLVTESKNGVIVSLTPTSKK